MKLDNCCFSLWIIYCYLGIFNFLLAIVFVIWFPFIDLVLAWTNLLIYGKLVIQNVYFFLHTGPSCDVIPIRKPVDHFICKVDQLTKLDSELVVPRNESWIILTQTCAEPIEQQQQVNAKYVLDKTLIS